MGGASMCVERRAKAKMSRKSVKSTLVALHGLTAVYFMPSWQHALLATAMFALLLVYFAAKNRFRLAETSIPDVFLLIFYARYALPPFFASLYCGYPLAINGLAFSECEEIYSAEAMAYLLIGQGLFVVSIISLWPRRKAHEPVIEASIDPEIERLGMLCFVIFFAIAVVPFLYPPISSIPSINQVFMPSAYLSLAILVTYLIGSKNFWPFKSLAVAVFVIYLLKLTSNAILTQALTAVLLVFIVYYRSSLRLSVRWIAVIAFVFATAYPATGDFRHKDWYFKEYEDYTVAEKAAAFVKNYFEFNINTASCFLFNDLEDRLCIKDGRIKLMLQRLAHLPHASRAMAVTPDEIDYWAGESYTPLLFALVPRAIYPNKPEERLGGYFNTEYWHSKTEGMSMNVPVEVEAYLNFGRSGLILSPAVIALIFLGIRWMPMSRMPEIENLKLLIVLPLLFPDGNFSLIFGNAIKFFICFAVILYSLGWTWRKGRSPSSPKS